MDIMTTERELIQRLADELDAETGYTIHRTGERVAHPDVVEARAFLAQTEPQGPTQEEAVALYSEVMAVHECQTLGEMAEHFSHAVLARWGRHAIEPPAKLAHNTAQHSGQRP